MSYRITYYSPTVQQSILALPPQRVYRNAKMTDEKMLTHEALLEMLTAKPGVAEEVARLNREEYALLDQMLAARKAAGMSQADVAEKMGIKAAAISRLESALASGERSPTIDTLRRYAEATGQILDIRFLPKRG